LFNIYYELKDTTKLPLGGVFVDPYDQEAFVVVQGVSSLEDFLDRIEKRREKKGFEPYSRDHLRVLVNIALAESANQKTLDKYFNRVAQVPEYSQLISLAKGITNQLSSGESVSYLKRQKRAQKCMG